MPKKANRLWESRTCKVCKHRFATIERAQNHVGCGLNAVPKNSPPENPNQVAVPSALGQAMEFSQTKYISDLENKNRQLREVATELVATVAEIALRRIR